MSWFTIRDRDGAVIGRVFAQAAADLLANTPPGATAEPDSPAPPTAQASRS